MADWKLREFSNNAEKIYIELMWVLKGSFTLFA